MDFDHNNVRAKLNDEDRLSGLPLELILQILTRVDTKLAIQTCLLLIPKWKLIWTSMPCLNFSSIEFKTLAKFSKFVTHVLSQRNHQVQVSSVNLCLHGDDTQDNFVREILYYVFSYNVQELILDIRLENEFRPYFIRSQTLKHLTFRTFNCDVCVTPKTHWNFPALTTLHLDDISLCDDFCESVDPFSKFVNLQNLTLELVTVNAKVFEIIAPRLSNLRLISSNSSNVINVIAPQLENLTIIDCSINDLNIPSGFSSFYYQAYDPRQWLKDRFHPMNKVTVIFPIHCPIRPYVREDARGIINILQELHNVRYLTLNLDIVECISAFPNLLYAQRSPFSNLIRLNIDSGTRDTCKHKMSTEARNFLLANSPNATFIMKELPTQAMKYKEVLETIKAKMIADIEDVMKGLQASQSIDHTKLIFEKNVVELTDMITQENHDVRPLISKTGQVRSLLDRFPIVERKQLEERYFNHLELAETLIAHRDSNNNVLHKIVDAFSKHKHPLPSQTSSSSSSIIIPT